MREQAVAHSVRARVCPRPNSFDRAQRDRPSVGWEPRENF